MGRTILLLLRAPLLLLRARFLLRLRVRRFGGCGRMGSTCGPGDEDCHYWAAKCGEEHTAECANGDASGRLCGRLPGLRGMRWMRWWSGTGIAFRFVDTAGIRRKGKTKLMAEKLW